MPAKKIVSDSYTIRSPFVTIDGNLNVLGTQTTISTTDSSITDNVIILNDGETGNGIKNGEPGATAGIMVDRGSDSDGNPNSMVGIRYDESTDRWQLTNDGSTWNNVLSSAGSGLGLENVVEDLSPELGGDLDLSGKSFVDSTVDSDVKLFMAEVAGGGSGVFINNSEFPADPAEPNNNAQELVIKRKAFIYALIF